MTAIGPVLLAILTTRQNAHLAEFRLSLIFSTRIHALTAVLMGSIRQASDANHAVRTAKLAQNRQVFAPIAT
jgi:hypothetical protein